MKLSFQDIRDTCGKAATSRGQEYFQTGRVLTFSAVINPDEFGVTLLGSVKGSGNNNYEQTVGLFPDADFVDIEGHCSCPVRYNCKHVAALCFHYQRNPETATQRSPLKVISNNLGPGPNDLTPGITSWLLDLSESEGEADAMRLPVADYPVYVLTKTPNAQQPLHVDATIRVTHPRKNGKGLVKGKPASPDELTSTYFRHGCRIDDIDLDIGRLLSGLAERFWGANHRISLTGRSGFVAVSLMIESGRCYWANTNQSPLRLGDPKTLSVTWKEQESGNLSIDFGELTASNIIPTNPPFYIDAESSIIGLVECGEWSANQLTMLFKAPEIPADQITQLDQILVERFPTLPLPPTDPTALRENPGDSMRPCITLSNTPVMLGEVYTVSLSFDYDGDRVPGFPFQPISRISTSAGRVAVHRRPEQEESAVARLLEIGLTQYMPSHYQTQSVIFCALDRIGEQRNDLTIWCRIIDEELDKLRAEGWIIEQDQDFRLQFREADWEAPVLEDIDEPGTDWFTMGFDLIVDDNRLPLAPLLAELVHTNPDEMPEILTLELEPHQFVRLPAARIIPFIETLKDLFNRLPLNEKGQFKVSRFDALSINELGDRIQGGQQLRELAEKLQDFSGIRPVDVPQGFKSELRPYQQSGLDWLGFLSEYGFNGILADDMGLGKTIQTLAHLLVQKNEGLLDAPCLIVAPTSLMGNWRREIEKFTPELSALVLHGPQRSQYYAELSDYDIILTTYPLLSRDEAHISALKYHTIVLDEAQAIKNPKTKMASTVRKLKAQHRLCLSGTPLENHLGELWSLFDFLMPGFLGSLDQFTRFFRTPIERHSDLQRQAMLTKRVQPFLLRRSKTEVAKELPPKTEILQNVQLGRAQAELYESIRISMDKRVREAIASQGVARSHITILDALLKLRQICCDPRLLSLKQAQTLNQSAKLELLMELLPDQLAQGRRILLFSQFTSMLSLIEQELNSQQIPYTKLTGQTRKRDEVIDRFQSGEVNLFLISLKAGGTGLNLTEADTVVLYDPWWNPAVEDQAIDRAHRIGQDKPVFIYKMVVENSVEQKMLAMQDKKRALANSVYSEQTANFSLTDADTLSELFAPLSE